MKKLLFTLLITTFGFFTNAQSVSFKASASSNPIGTEEQLQVSYAISGSGQIVGLNPPDFKNVQVLSGPNRSYFTNIVQRGNSFEQQSTVTFSYIVQPTKAGTLVLPPLTLKDENGQTYTSNSVTVKVVQGRTAPARPQRNSNPFANDPFFEDAFERMFGHRNRRPQQQPRTQNAPNEITEKDLHKHVFIRVIVDKKNVVQGEQVTAYYKLYSSLPMQMSISKLPSLNGFWTQDFQLPSELKPVEETVNGVKYQVFTLKKSALFPQQVGQLTLDPAEADGVVYVPQRVQMRNPFEDFFANDPFFQQFGGSLMMDDNFGDVFGGYQFKQIKTKIKSQPVTINVRPLPDHSKIKNFTGAVGQFTISASLDKHEITTNEAANLKLTISGTGNLKLIDPPTLDLPTGLSGYDPIGTDTITGKTTVIKGEKTFTYTLSSATAGKFKIEPITFSFYDPQSRSYQTLTTAALDLNIKQGLQKNNSTQKANSNRFVFAEIFQGQYKDGDRDQRFLMIKKPVFWSLFVLPIFALVGIVGWRKRNENLKSDVVKYRKLKAGKVAEKRLRKAKTLLVGNKKDEFYEELSKAIWLFLSDKMNIPLSLLSRQNLETEWQKKNLNKDILNNTQTVMDNCAQALYAPGNHGQMAADYEQSAELISQLDKLFKA